MADFGIAHKFTAKWEGGISDHPTDRGGYTAYGVCEEFLKDLFTSATGRVFLRSLGFSASFRKAEMKRLLSPDVAARIFRYSFWDGQDLSPWPSQALATVYYDMSVNHGKHGACLKLQQALNNSGGAGLKVDGIYGPATRAAAMGQGRDAALELIRIRENYFRNIVQNRPSQKVFLKGWLNRAADLKRHVANMN